MRRLTAAITICALLGAGLTANGLVPGLGTMGMTGLAGTADAAAAATTTTAKAAMIASATSFSDIKGHWAEATIKDMLARGILDGYPDGTFRPDAPVQVDQFIKMLIVSETDLYNNGERNWSQPFLNSLSAENQTILKQDYRYFDFKSSTTGYWAKTFIDVASDLNFLNKSRYADFQTDMTRENVAEVIYYTLKETEYLEDESFGQKLASSYGDIRSASEREQKFIGETLAKGIIQGYPNGYFGVGDIVTRAQALVILNRLTEPASRIAVPVSAADLERALPTASGGRKVVVFPDQRMYDAYDVLAQAGALRGTNQDLYDTTLRLYKDADEKASVAGRAANAKEPTEETTLWLDPQYNTYGITIRLREGAFARNQEAVQTFGNYLFGYNASTFSQLFSDICTKVAAGQTIESRKTVIGDDNVDIQIDNANKTVIFSIAKKK
ncbi:S-layer homology domain-containing protein [Cohnella fermenti]|uniref:S-layer homology domain-containing protein n=1 Tax=Cohnella fermenti TaxID=2565925 RepID=A0A4S4BSM9_9BACL|nr:S-layer homology domain-containing protein [Cohnella fermenti]THF78056.1 S-layer homology domain-containing protein [Cohnella fermenti]